MFAASGPPGVPTVFDPAPLREPSGTLATLWQALLLHPVTLFALRQLFASPRIAGIRVISHYDDAREALSRPDVFGVPWLAKMHMLAPSKEPFVLATDAPGVHACGERRVMEVFRYDDTARIASIAAATANLVLEQPGPDLDVVQGLILPVATAVYQQHYGIETPPDLALWLMAMSTFTFRQIGADPAMQTNALAAAVKVAAVLATAITRAKANPGLSDTIVDRLLALQCRAPGRFPNDALTSTLTGMVSGYAPVGTTAAVNILEVLLSKPKALEATRQAARDNDERLTQHLLEALRFKPINPGLFRVCQTDYTLAANTARATDIRQGEHVIVLLQSAMQDESRLPHAWRFDPERPASQSMVFGYGMHWCVGAPLGMAQLLPMLRPLLLRGFRRTTGQAGKTRLFGSFPEHLSLTLGRG